MALIEVFMVLLNSFIAVFVAIIVYYKNCYTFWKNKKVPYLTPQIPLGNSQNPLFRRSSIYEHLKLIYDRMKHQNAKHCGVYTFVSPVYVPIDLDYVRNVLIRDFENFTDRGLYFDEKNDPLSAQLVSLEGERWKKLRKKLTPTFTSGKIKNMHNLILQCAEQMVAAIPRMENCHLDIKELLGCYTTDVISTCAFGIACNSFEEEKSRFRLYGTKIFRPSVLKMAKTVFCLTFSEISRRLGLRLIDEDVSEFFVEAIKATVKYREENGVQRNDFLQILIDLKGAEDGLTIEEVAAQAFVFFSAGFETSSTTLTFCLYELSKHRDIQEKLREEIRRKHEEHQGFTYEAVNEMKYMNQVLEETLRKYPAVPIINRICTKPYHLPESDSQLEKGVKVLIPTFAIHRDPDLYPKPDYFEPERFSPENAAKRHPFAYLPFGLGPRSCIGMRFGLMQSKTGLAALLRDHEFTLNFNTKDPIRFDRNSFLLAAKDAIWLNVNKIE